MTNQKANTETAVVSQNNDDKRRIPIIGYNELDRKLYAKSPHARCVELDNYCNDCGVYLRVSYYGPRDGDVLVFDCVMCNQIRRVIRVGLGEEFKEPNEID
jgi:hypothetical protein